MPSPFSDKSVARLDELNQLFRGCYLSGPLTWDTMKNNLSTMEEYSKAQWDSLVPSFPEVEGEILSLEDFHITNLTIDGRACREWREATDKYGLEPEEIYKLHLYCTELINQRSFGHGVDYRRWRKVSGAVSGFCGSLRTKIRAVDIKIKESCSPTNEPPFPGEASEESDASGPVLTRRSASSQQWEDSPSPAKKSKEWLEEPATHDNPDSPQGSYGRVEAGGVRLSVQSGIAAGGSSAQGSENKIALRDAEEKDVK